MVVTGAESREYGEALRREPGPEIVRVRTLALGWQLVWPPGAEGLASGALLMLDPLTAKEKGRMPPPRVTCGSSVSAPRSGAGAYCNPTISVTESI